MTPTSSCSTPRTTPSPSSRRSPAATSLRWSHPRTQRPRQRRTGARRAARRARPAASRRRMLWRRIRTRTPAASTTAWCSTSATGELRALHTPGHSPGSAAVTRRTWVRCSAATPCSVAVPERPDGRTPTSRPSWRRSRNPGPLPADTVVYTGHGDSTTIGDEIVHYDEWVARGH